MITLAVSVYLFLLLLVMLFFVARYRANTRRERMLRVMRQTRMADANQEGVQFGFVHSATR